MRFTVRSKAPGLLALTLVVIPAAAQQPAPTSAPPAIGRRLVSPGNAEWAASTADARAKAKAQKKLVYYEFADPDCGNCRRMESLLYPAFDFEALLVGMVPVRLSLDSPDGRELGRRYTISEMPSILITSPEGRLAFLMQGFKDAPDFYRHVHKDLDAYRAFAKRVDSQDVASLSAEEAYVTGTALYKRSDFEGAVARLKRAATAPNAKPPTSENALEGLAAARLELGQTAESRRAIDKVIATTKNPEQKERAELFLAQIALTENKPGEALALYEKFAKSHPTSKYLEKVRSFIERLQAAAPPKS